MYYKAINRMGHMLLYVPYKHRCDIVRIALINGVMNYCVNDFGKKGCINNSTYVWDKNEGLYLQFAPNVNDICNNTYKLPIRLFKNS